MRSNSDTIEAILRDRIARGEASSHAAVPILRHLVRTDGSDFAFSEETVARVRGMIGHLARQLLPDEAAAPGHTQLIARLVDDGALLSHVHALALEGQLARRLQATLALDPVLPPLVQSLIDRSGGDVANSAMRLLAAQTRFDRQHRLMELPLSELPQNLFANALRTMRALAGSEPEGDEHADATERRTFAIESDEGDRLHLISSILRHMGEQGATALELKHTGVAIFLSALAERSGQTREAVCLAASVGDEALLALMLRSAGVSISQVQEQLLALGRDIALPRGFEGMSVDRAAILLSDGSDRVL